MNTLDGSVRQHETCPRAMKILYQTSVFIVFNRKTDQRLMLDVQVKIMYDKTA